MIAALPRPNADLAALEAELVGTIEAQFPAPYLRDLEDLLGVTGTAAIAAWLPPLVGGQFGGVTKVLFAVKSVGAVFGFECESGTRAVIKLFSRQLSGAQLAATRRCEHAL